MKIINVTDNDISELIKMLDKLNNRNLYLYWLIREKNDIRLLNSMKENINQILDHYRSQIAKMYMLNIIEQDLLNTKNTSLNLILERLKNKLYSEKVLDSDILNKLCISNIDTIFNNVDKNKLNYKLVYDENIEGKIKESQYLNSAFEYANSFCLKQKMKKKIPNIV